MRANRLILTLAFLCLLAGALACGSILDEEETGAGAVPAPDEQTPKAVQSSPGSIPGDVWRPVPGTSWQWQLTGEIDTTYDVVMYDIDLFEAPGEVIGKLHDDGRIVICYFSAGTWEEWRPDVAVFPQTIIGKALADWPDEKWLDVSQLSLLRPPMAARLDLAVKKGCDGVEPDNITAYNNDSGFTISTEDQLIYNRWLADAAHQRGLSIGLKNDLEQIVDLEPFFDWALNEECFQYDECETLQPFILAGKAVFGVEYEGDPEEFCPLANAFDYDWLLKDWDLGPERLACR